MPRKSRIVLAALFLVGITLLFTGIGGRCLGWMAKCQFLPSLLAFNFVAIASIILLTLLVGRIYCSVICPLGVFQDAVIALRKKFRHRRSFRFHAECKWLRYGVFALFVAALLAGIQPLVALFAPYSSYGRIVGAFLNVSDGSGWIAAGIGFGTFIIMVALAWWMGREWCTSICPVGTFLGFFSRFALFRVRIDKNACMHCGSCVRGCRSSCIDLENGKIDGSRCVDCFDCLDNCRFGAISIKPSDWLKRPFKSAPNGNSENKSSGSPVPEPEDIDSSRREFLAATALLATSAAASARDEFLADGALAPVIPKSSPERDVCLVPFGALSQKNFYSRCTACQLCVATCPNDVLRPRTDIAHFMQPQMSYEKGWCRPECDECSKVCPSGAIRPVEAGEKLLTHIGTAKVDLKLCVVNRDDVNCGNCARHCPVGAIRMVPKDDGSGRSIPSVNTELCIGCGACENLCPSRPVSAITVNGLEVHRR